MPDFEINKRIIEVFEFQKKVQGGYTQQQFAAQIGVSYTTINEVFNNKKGAGMNVIGGILFAFVDIDARWLITGEGQMVIEKINKTDDIQSMKDELRYHRNLVKDLIEIAKGRFVNNDSNIP
jgi:hypothetical protein